MSEVTDTTTRTSQDDTLFPRWLYFFFGGVVLLVAFLLGLYFSQFNSGWGSQETFAQFGDFVGGTLNPVLGFATVALLIWSINVQMKELRLTREEVAATKDEAAMSRKAMEAQVEHFEKEAKLSELTRLIQVETQQYESLMSVELYGSEVLSRVVRRFSEKIDVTVTIGDIIRGSHQGYEFSKDLDEQLFTQINNDRLANYNDRRWARLEVSAKIITTLTIEYMDRNQSTAFNLAQGSNSYFIIKNVTSILRTESLIAVRDLLEEKLKIAGE
ncbi:MAG: hypothetical protein HRU23_19055 [Gammaproteobacteria bacterium]|nr:hypothetical protein [Gammaproteobacteria bacterium]